MPVETVVYKGFGHGITKPKSMRAVMMHNLLWFNHYIFGEPLPDLRKPEIPKKPEDAKPAASPTPTPSPSPSPSPSLR